MASVEQQAPDEVAVNGSNGSAGSIPVENPATGEIIATVPDLSADEVRAMAAKARQVQPGWEALGFEGRARILQRAQRWIIDNRDRITDTIISETGKTYEDVQLAEVAYGAAASASGPRTRRSTSPTRRSARRTCSSGQEAEGPLAPARPRRRDRSLELPAHQLVLRLRSPRWSPATR